MKTIHINTASASYDAIVGAGILTQLGSLLARRLARSPTAAPARAFLACDSGLPAATVDLAKAALAGAGFTVTAAFITASELNKSITDLDRILGELAASKHERFEPVIALGGGITGDLVGFAAASYRRGVPIVQCPTTLLSMVDASVGGKTGINLQVGAASAPGGAPAHDAGSIKKNLVGAFHQPLLVLADVTTLASLPDRHHRAGLAECIKHGMIAADLGSTFTDPSLFDWTRQSMPMVLARDAIALAELIHRNIAVKAAVIATDEREELPAEKGGRALLNLGHTFGHAIEPLAHLSPDDNAAGSPLHHGEAVALGLLAATHCAASAGLCSASLPAIVASAVSSAKLPTRLNDLPPNDKLLELMSHDKKVVGGKLRLVLPIGDQVGKCRVVEGVDPRHIAAGWDAIR